MRQTSSLSVPVRHVGAVLIIVVFLKQYVLKMFLRYLVTTKIATNTWIFYLIALWIFCMGIQPKCKLVPSFLF